MRKLSEDRPSSRTICIGAIMRIQQPILITATLLLMSCATKQQETQQSGIIIKSDTECETCDIVFSDVATISGAQFEGPNTTIARDSAGRFYLADATDGLLKVYTASGQFLWQLGRRGAGPGEYELIRNILPAADGSVQVLDGALARRSHYSADGTFLGSTPTAVIGGIGMSAALLGNSLVINALPASREVSGNALQIIDPQGRPTAWFGDASPFDPSKRWLQQRLLWVRRSGELLVAEPFTFTIDVYRPDFTKKESITRTADWLPTRPPDARPSDGVFDKPFTPRLGGMWEDSGGLLWLYIAVPAPDWKPGPVADPHAMPSGGAYAALAARPRVQTMLEVIDVERRHVLARARLTKSPGLSFGQGYFVHSIDDSLGEPGLRIVKVQINR